MSSPQLHAAIVSGDHAAAAAQTAALISAGETPTGVLERTLLPAMQEVGAKFRAGEVFLPQVLVSARAMKAAMGVLEPLLASSNYQPRGKVLLGTVKGDVHDIGKNLVGVMLRGAGFAVVDIGTGCSAEKFLDAVRVHRPDVLGLSALLTTTMTYMRSVIETVRAAGETLPIIVGGAPVNAEFAAAIGATGSARTAAEAVDLVGRLVNGSGGRAA